MFVAVYWWRVKPGRRTSSAKPGAAETEAITALYGSHGSRLHRERDGRFVAYAEWPDEESWQRAFDARMVYDDPPVRAMFVDAIAETPPGNLPVFTMTVTDDLLDRRSTR